MATRNANVKGINFLYEPRGSALEFLAVVTFDLLGVVYTGGSDTIQIGGGGFDAGIATTLTLAQLIQNRRRDGKTVTLYGVFAGPPGRQAAATNGPELYVQSAAVSTGNIGSIVLFNAITGGSAITATATGWDAAAAIFVMGQATGY
ncbi:MAG TPA: hypothetical protein VGI39_39080 [Polyangiaceae bacterium]|jgi:hypothetical protein